MPTLGKFIRRRREELGLTQERLAELVGDGVRQAEISRLENDRIILPRRQRLEQIAIALEVPIGTLLARSGWAGAEEIEPLPDGHSLIERGLAASGGGETTSALITRTTNSFLLSVLDGVEDGVTVIDAEGDIIMSNASYNGLAQPDDQGAVFFDEQRRIVATANRWYGPIVHEDEYETEIYTLAGDEGVTYTAHSRLITADLDEIDAFRIITVKACEED